MRGVGEQDAGRCWRRRTMRLCSYGALCLSRRPAAAGADLAARRSLTTDPLTPLWLAQGTLVAVKLLLGVDDATRARFAGEVAVLASLRHPNLILFMGWCHEPHLAIISE